jgi:hypothetical protein
MVPGIVPPSGASLQANTCETPRNWFGGVPQMRRQLGLQGVSPALGLFLTSQKESPLPSGYQLKAARILAGMERRKLGANREPLGLYSHGEYRHCDTDSSAVDTGPASAVDTGPAEDMSTALGAGGKSRGAAASTPIMMATAIRTIRTVIPKLLRETPASTGEWDWGGGLLPESETENCDGHHIFTFFPRCSQDARRASPRYGRS